jgi:hypothetical protein
MQTTYCVTVEGTPHHISVEGATLFELPNGGALIQYWTQDDHHFRSVHADQSFSEVVRLHEQARGTNSPSRPNDPA